MKEDKSFGIILISRQNNKPDKFLIIQHVLLHWGFPKGHANKNENSKQAAARELEEETGIKNIIFLDFPSIFEKYVFTKENIVYNKTVEYFIAFTNETEVSIQEEEIRNYKWATYEEAMTVLTNQEAKDILDLVVSYLDEKGINKEILFNSKFTKIFQEKEEEREKYYKARAVVLDENNQIILTREPLKNRIGLVGGTIDEGETIKEALFRECKEETGYDVEIITSLGRHTFFKKYQSTHFVFLVKTVGEQQIFSLTEEELESGQEIVRISINNFSDFLRQNYALDESLEWVETCIKESQKYL